MANLEQLVQSTVAGDPEAWRALQLALEPLIESIARRHPDMRAKGLAALPDEVAEVKVTVLERLARADFQNLRRFLERARANAEQPEGFESWAYGAVDFTIREHLRRRYGRAPKPADTLEARVPRPSKRELQSQAPRLDDERVERSFLTTLGMTTRLTAAQILAHIEQDFAPQDAQAMRLYYLEDRSFGDMAEILGLDNDKSAERTIRRLNARLRYHFVKPDADK